MAKFQSAIICLFLPTVLLFAQEQTVINVSEDQASGHLLQTVPPEYPPFARAAGIEGTVALCAQIDADGHVLGMFPVTGPTALQDAAQRSLGQSLYKPFELNGKPTAARAWVRVRFQLPKDANARAYPTPKLSLDSYYPSQTKDALAVGFSSLSPELRNWFRKVIDDLLDGAYPPSERDRVVQTAVSATTVFAIPGKEPRGYLYLFNTKSQEMCGATGNCLMLLAQQRGAAISIVAQTSAWGFALYQRSASPYPDILFSTHMSAFETAIEGYGNAGGMWGELYSDMLGKRPDDEAPSPYLCKP